MKATVVILFPGSKTVLSFLGVGVLVSQNIHDFKITFN